MADIEITGKRFMNYTDLRAKEELPQIEIETIRNYAKGLTGEQLKVFLEEVSDEALVTAISIRLMARQNKIDNIMRYIGL